jgi:hypothetical protein
MKSLIRQVLKEYINIKYNLVEQKADTKPNPSKTIKGALFLKGKALDSLKTNDEKISGSYSAEGKSGAYDALHSFHMRASDRFGGRINSKVKEGIIKYKKNTGEKKIDIKNVKININPNTLTVNWEVTIGPSKDGYTYEEFDSRGSAGGGEGAVDKQLSSMHSYHSGEPKLVHHFNKTIPVCYNSNGKKKTDGCKGTINIQQKFYKYGKKVK